MTKLIAAFGTLGLSFSSIFVRFADADSIVLAFYRMAFATLLLAPVIFMRHREEYRKLSAKQFVFCALGGVCFGLHLHLAFMAFASTTIAAATVLINTEVFFVALGEFVLEKKRISFRQLAAILTAFAGSVIIAGGDAASGMARLSGDLFALLGAFGSAIYTLMAKRSRKELSTTAYTGIVYFFAMATIGGMMAADHTPFVGYAPLNYLLALGLALIPTFLGHSIFSYCLKYESAAYVSLVKLLEPVFATIMGIFFFKEIPAAMTAAGGLLVICGIIIYIRSSLNDERTN